MEDREILQAILEKVTGMESDISEIRQRVTKIEVTQEQVTDKNIQLLMEGQRGINEKFEKMDQVAEDVEEIKLTVRAMEAVTQRNSNDIKRLRAVK